MSRAADYKAFGARLMQLRAKLGMNRTQFAAFIETHYESVQHWEHGDSYPNYWSVVKIAEKCNVGFGWLFTGL
jgi:DNA-binding transcriptional regulator YiaG